MKQIGYNRYEEVLTDDRKVSHYPVTLRHFRRNFIKALFEIKLSKANKAVDTLKRAYGNDKDTNDMIVSRQNLDISMTDDKFTQDVRNIKSG